MFAASKGHFDWGERWDKLTSIRKDVETVRGGPRLGRGEIDKEQVSPQETRNPDRGEVKVIPLEVWQVVGSSPRWNVGSRAWDLRFVCHSAKSASQLPCDRSQIKITQGGRVDRWGIKQRSRCLTMSLYKSCNLPNLPVYSTTNRHLKPHQKQNPLSPYKSFCALLSRIWSIYPVTTIPSLWSNRLSKDPTKQFQHLILSYTSPYFYLLQSGWIWDIYCYHGYFAAETDIKK